MLDAHRSAVHGMAASFYAADVLREWAPMSSQVRTERLAKRIASGEEVAVVAEDGVVVGFGSIVPELSELRAVYVRADCGRRGIGTRILDLLEELARGLGLVELHMNASLNAEAFYRAKGYAAVSYGEHVLDSGKKMACVRMHKLL